MKTFLQTEGKLDDISKFKLAV